MSERACTAQTKRGEPCRSFVPPGGERCLAHDPARAEQARAARSQGATTANKLRAIRGQRPRLERPAELLAFTAGVIHDTADGRLDPTVARTLFYGISVQKTLIEVGDLAARLEALEAVLRARRTG